jgi:hypothetical protein
VNCPTAPVARMPTAAAQAFPGRTDLRRRTELSDGEKFKVVLREEGRPGGSSSLTEWYTIGKFGGKTRPAAAGRPGNWRTSPVGPPLRAGATPGGGVTRRSRHRPPPRVECGGVVRPQPRRGRGASPPSRRHSRRCPRRAREPRPGSRGPAAIAPSGSPQRGQQQTAPRLRRRASPNRDQFGRTRAAAGRAVRTRTSPDVPVPAGVGFVVFIAVLPAGLDCSVSFPADVRGMPGGLTAGPE